MVDKKRIFVLTLLVALLTAVIAPMTASAVEPPHPYSLLGAVKASLDDEKVYYPVIVDNGTLSTYDSAYDGAI